MNFNSVSSIRAALLALILICLTFPDVIFHGASLRVTDQMAGAEQHLKLHSVYPTLIKRNWWESYTDYGGSLYQSDPMIEFMSYCIWTHNSPYWNPYSAAGQFGPETLVDQKFSIFTLLNAIFGGGTYVYNVILLFCYFLGTYFIYRIAQTQLLLSPIAGTAMGIFYLLNGYIVANTSSNVALNYLVVPACLYTSFSFLTKVSVVKFINLILSLAALLSFTFLPTTIGSVISIYVLCLGFTLVLKHRGIIMNYSQLAIKLIFHFLALLLALCSLGFLYLPIVESLSSTDTLEMYIQRVLYPVHWQGILSLFAPSHFYESYSAMEPGAWRLIGNVVFHFGIVTFGLIACALGNWRQEKKSLIIVCFSIIFVIFCRIFGVPGISSIFSHLPILGNLGCQYWWSAIVFPLCFLVGVGIDNLEQRDISKIPLFILLGIGSLVEIGVLFTYGLHPPFMLFKLFSLISMGIITFIVITLIYKIYKTDNMKSRKTLIGMLVLLMFIELTMDTKYFHYQTNDLFKQPLPEINFIKSNIGNYRTMTIGNTQGILHGVRPELGSAYQIQEITSMNGGGLQSYINYFHKTITLGYNPVHSMFTTLVYMEDKPETNKIDWNVVNLLGVKYILVPSYFKNYSKLLLKRGLPLVYENPSVKIYENPKVTPRAFGTILSSKPNGHNVDLPLDFSSHLNKVEITRYRNAEVQLEGFADQPMLIVLTDNWQKNWKATLNDKPVSIIQVNEIFRGIWVPQGRFTIDMYYQPRTLLLGIILSLGIMLGTLLLFVFRNKVDRFFNNKVNSKVGGH